ncbi:hypothetical protein MIMGU_mgv1a000789mg [Erythranthe guttata]|uniref:DNA topoisomerase n=1 Tax=Erythranthe guttata TaxID=4155 RepID=A0A022QQM7_ERYGU|nr:hypothetical protein MIMGU_mgv1a000789mg [Erythranthe guttata]
MFLKCLSANAEKSVNLPLENKPEKKIHPLRSFANTHPSFSAFKVPVNASYYGLLSGGMCSNYCSSSSRSFSQMAKAIAQNNIVKTESRSSEMNNLFEIFNKDSETSLVRKKNVHIPKGKAKSKQQSRSKKKQNQSSGAGSVDTSHMPKNPGNISQAKETRNNKRKKTPISLEVNSTSNTTELVDSNISTETVQNNARSSTKKGKSKTKSHSSPKSNEELIEPKDSQVINKTKPQGQKVWNQLYPPVAKSVVVVESATKAKVIQAYLGEMYEVVPSYGHVRDLAARSGSVRPEKDFSMVWEVPSAAWSHLKSIKVALCGAENLILASDPDREGEAIAWHILEMLKQQDALREDVTVARVVFNEITESSIKNALRAPREIDVDLVHAYLARRALDYLIGFNVSPLLLRKLPGCQSAGRVQSAALSLLCINMSKFEVTGSITSKSRRNPPMPYITSSLQQDAGDKLNFAASHTMKVAQKLFEGVELSDGKAAGLITYMRTDGLHLSDEATKEIQSFVVEKFGQNFAEKNKRNYFKKVKNAEEAHEAIRPTDIRTLPSMLAGVLDEDSLKLYTLIWNRTVACQMEPAIIEHIQCDIANANQSIVFRSSCSRVEFEGFQAVYEDEENHRSEEAHEVLSALKCGQPLSLTKIELSQHSTQPPTRYSEGSLVKKLEELGIGRPSTYATTIKVLKDRNYVTVKSSTLHPEFRGRMVSAFLAHYFSEVTDYSFTADMETELDNVSSGITEWKGLMKDYWTRFSKHCECASGVSIHQVEKVLGKTFGSFLFASLQDGNKTCPSCNEGTLVFKVSRFGVGYFIGCDQHPNCKYIAKTLYGEEDDENTPENEKNIAAEEPKLLGLKPGSNEKVILKCGPYSSYVQLGDDRKGHVPKRVTLKIKNPESITLEDALELLKYPLKLGKHPDDDKPVILRIRDDGFSINHGRTNAAVPKNMNANEVTFEKALILLQGDVTQVGRPKQSDVTKIRRPKRKKSG